MILQQIDLAVGTHRGIVDAIAKKVYTIVKRNHQFFWRADFSIVICKCFHNNSSSILRLWLGKAPRADMESAPTVLAECSPCGS